MPTLIAESPNADRLSGRDRHNRHSGIRLPHADVGIEVSIEIIG